MSFKDKWRQKMIMMMKGRYATNDRLNQHIVVLSLILLVGTLFFPHSLMMLLPLALLFISYGRMFSKNSQKRQKENQRYTVFLQDCQFYWHKLKNYRTYHYLKCPDCQQKYRVPKGKGHIKVTCSNCHKQQEMNT